MGPRGRGRAVAPRPDREGRGSLSVRQIDAAFEECARILRERIRSLGHEGPATFYVWHDGQLRCSTTTAPRDQLPFGAPLAVIVAEFLEDVSPGFVSWEELAPSADETPPEGYVVQVWTAEVGGTRT